MDFGFFTRCDCIHNSWLIDYGFPPDGRFDYYSYEYYKSNLTI